MGANESYGASNYDEQIQMAEAELSAFVAAVTELFGAEQARRSAEDWLDESELMDSAPRSTGRQWRAVTIAASTRLANRLTAARHRMPSVALIDAKVSPTLVEFFRIPAYGLLASSDGKEIHEFN